MGESSIPSFFGQFSFHDPLFILVFFILRFNTLPILTMSKLRSLFYTISTCSLVTLLIIITSNLNEDLEPLNVQELRSFYENIVISPPPCQIDDLVILIHSAINNTKNRNILRTFIPHSFKIVFVVGQSYESQDNLRIRNESMEFDDLLVGSFIDSYRNLTVKHLTGYQYIQTKCRRASIIIKTDDDIFINFKELEKYLNKEFPDKNDPLQITDRVGYNMFRCYVIHKAMVVRRKTRQYQKWAVPRSVYKDRLYPDYCSGWAYITTVGAIDIILDKLIYSDQNSPTFWIDDVYITGILRQESMNMNFAISLESMNEYFCRNIDALHNWLNASHYSRYIFSNTDSDTILLAKLYEHAILNQNSSVEKDISPPMIGNGVEKSKMIGVAKVSQIPMG